MGTHVCGGIRNINHVHREIPPVIHIHNKTPFDSYEAAINELKMKILHPGEIAIAYYYNPTADDGISSVIATGPLQQGGYNEIFKNASDIDYIIREVDSNTESLYWKPLKGSSSHSSNSNNWNDQNDSSLNG